jgi:hypothetical protein
MPRRRLNLRSGGSLRVDALSWRYRVELGIGGFLLVQIGIEEPHDVVVT